MNTLFVSWQDPEKRRWYPVGRLTFDKPVYKFVYTVGAREAENFSPFFGMGDLEAVYESEQLFPIFSNRLLSNTRPEYARLINWLSLNTKDIDPFSILSLTGGVRKTDSIEIFPCPVPTPNANYEMSFFSRGLSHQPEGTRNRVNQLKPGDRLFLMKDVQSQYDALALALRTDDPVSIVGYCPRYLAPDLNDLMNKNGVDCVNVTVHKVNPDAPYQLRLLCKIISPWPQGFKACSGDLYRPLPEELTDERNCAVS